MSRQELIRRLAARTTGVSADEVPGCDKPHASRSMRKLTALGQLHPARIDAKHFRYFAHAGMRDVFVADQAEIARQRALYSKGTAALPSAAPWTPDTPADTSRAKVTICPGFAPRFQPISVPGAPHSFYGAAGRCGVEAVAR
jgi:hypothetical protein